MRPHQCGPSGTSNSAKYQRTGLYGWEIYAARCNDFWLSPAYKQDVVRIDPFFFGYNSKTPRDSRFKSSVEEFFAGPWLALAEKFDVRFHWGKHLPSSALPVKPKDKSWPQYVKDQYPKWEDFERLRRELDPKDLFLNPYWSDRLGIS